MPVSLSQFLKPFEDSTRKTIQDLCSVKVNAVRPLPQGTWPKLETAVAGLIGITSPQIQGSMSIQFSREVFLAIFNRMLGESFTEISPELEDGAAELSNIIFGGAKVSLNEAGFGIQMALPTVLRGKNIHNAGATGNQTVQTMEFETECGSFFVVFQLNEKKADPSPPSTNASALKPSWSADVLLEFVRAVRKTLEVQFSADVQVGTPFLRSDANSFSFDVGSLIGITDHQFEGFFGMYYEKKTFLSLINHLLGTEYHDLNDEVQDGASEITNICFGVAKQVLNQQGHMIQMALPNLIRGDSIQSSSRSQKRNQIAVPLQTKHGKFWVEFGFSHPKHG
jgi:CheY-specific phosphatase CheX